MYNQIPHPTRSSSTLARTLCLLVTIAATGSSTVRAQVAPAQTTPQATRKTLHLPALAPRPGYAVGRAVFADGHPVPQFEIVVGGFDTAADASRGTMPVVGYAKATNGRYAVQIVDSFRHTKPVDARIASVEATAFVTYQSHLYKLKMFDLGGETGLNTFLGQGRKGVVRDFVLPMTGLRPGYTADESSETRYKNACYGGSVNVDGSISNKPDSNSEDETALTRAFPQGAVELTLMPNGPLLDGSTGQTQHVSIPVAAFKLGGNWHQRMLRGIPLGVYTATARLTLPGGASRPLRLKDSISITVPWQSSLSVTWVPDSYDLLEAPTLYVAQ